MNLLVRLVERTQKILFCGVIYLSLLSGAWAGSPTLVAQAGVTAPGSIAELARALKYDVNLIYEYVYTNIEYSPIYGAKKGALGTLLDGVGNDIDQSGLMIALLRQSGYTANYSYGLIRLYPPDLAAWLGIDTSTACTLLNLLLTEGGIPVIAYVYGPSPPACTQPLAYADIPHAWVSVTGGSLGATTYVFDPSYKTYVTTPGIDLASGLGYSQAAFLSVAEAGYTLTGNSIQNVNSANIAAALTGYADSLMAYIKTNMPTATLNDVVGGKYIQPLTQPYSPLTSLPYEAPGDTPAIWTDPPNDMRTTLEVMIGGIDKTYYADAIYGHRLSVVYNSSLQPVLYLDGLVQGTGTAGANTINYNVVLPYCYEGSSSIPSSCPSGSTDVFSFKNAIQTGSGYTYAILNGWGFVGRGMVEFHRRQLQINRSAGNSDSSEAVLGEGLNLIGYSWLAQYSSASDLNDRIVGTKSVIHCYVGVVAQVTGPYIDTPGGFLGISSLTDDDRSRTTLFGNIGDGSAFEWGTLNQNLSKSNVSAVSTVKLFDIANTQHDIIYDATSANWPSIAPLLQNYLPGDFNNIKNNYIDAGNRVLLPQHGNLSQGDWTGAGWLAISFTPTFQSLEYGISSNLKGGYPDFSIEPTVWIPVSLETNVPPPPPPDVVSFEPIDLSSGAFLYEHNDLSIGSADFPYGLTFRRSYNSSNQYTKGPLGPGWSHNLAISAAINSDGLKGMGQDSPIDGVAAIAAAYVMQDLFSDPAHPLAKVVIGTLVQRWFMDRLINNTVNIATASQTDQFILLADGSYNPRLGTSNRLSLNAGTYALQYKDGTTLNFNSAGNISNWNSPAGVVVNFAYDTSSPPLLASVSNNLGRTLNLTYNGSSQLTSAADNASPSRSISLAYDGFGNLSSFTDPIGNATAFVYSDAYGNQTPGLLTKIFYPSNPDTAFVTNSYDSLGRVATQANGNNAPGINTVWSYFFAGYRSEEDDPSGTQHVLYYNPRGKAVFDIQDLAGLNLVTENFYDGLDRVAAMTQPEGGGVEYFYDDTTNSWANNVATIIRFSKPTSPFAWLVTDYTYDPIFNKPTTINDPLGLITTMKYDSATGNLLSIVADAGHFNAQKSFSYDNHGLLLTATDPLGVVTQYQYDPFGNRTSTTGDAGIGGFNQTTMLTYSSRGDITSVTDPRGNLTTNTYDVARRLITTTSPATTAAPAGIVTTLSYDRDGRTILVQQSANASVLRTTSATYTPTGKQATVTDANANVARYAYDLLDRLASATDAAGRVTSYAYDALSRQTKIFNTAIQATPLVQQAYTPDGLRASLTDANGNTTNFAYDGFDRLATTTYPNPGTGSTTETFTYDADDNLLTRKTRASSTNSFSFAYDTLNRLITKTPQVGPVVNYSYNLNNRLTGVSDNSAAMIAAAPPVSNTLYATSYTYDGLNRPTNASWTPAPTATLPVVGSSVRFDYAYSKGNQRAAQSLNDSTWLSYPTATPGTTNYSANALNQYSVIGAVAPTYDANGNLTSDGTLVFGYDSDSRLVSASGAGNTAAYAFDAQGRRKSRTVNGTATISVTDADNREVLEYDGATGQVQRWYAYDLGANGVLNQMNVAAASRATYLPDIRGSIVAMVNSGTGALTKFGYLPYGKSASAPDQFGYTGQRIDSEAGGLYYYRSRHYSPVLGRFLQVDPVGYSAGANLYAYVGNDPLNLTDPTGLSPPTPGGGNANPSGPLINNSPLTTKLIAPYDPSQPNYHQYQFSDFLCNSGAEGCSSAAAYDALLRNAVPGGPNQGTPVVNGQVSPVSLAGIPGGNVITYTEPSSYSIVNVTEPGHVFEMGLVQRQIVAMNGGVYVNTYGVGINTSQFTKALNVDLAGLAFNSSTSAIRQAVNPNPYGLNLTGPWGR